MATGQLSEVLQHLGRMALPGGAELTDRQLLEDYLSRRDEAALDAIVRRHAPMVWGVCRRVLADYHVAEDAFQATFLVLTRKAASIASRELLANWLYGVAHQTALNARKTTAKRQKRERQVAEMPEPATTDPDVLSDLQPLIDQELSRLREKHRAVVVLCDLEGKTRTEAARQLGVPEGTVAGWLARARAVLAERLARRGIAIPCGASAMRLSQSVASAGVPPSVVSSTVKAASLFAASGAVAIPAGVAALTQRVLNAMLLSKLRNAAVALLAAFFLMAGVEGGLVAVGVLDAQFVLAGEQESKTALPSQPTVVDRNQPVPKARQAPQPAEKAAVPNLESEARRLEFEGEEKRKAGDLKGAADRLRRAVAIRHKQGNADAAARDRSALSDVLTKDGDLKGAADVLREAVLLWEAVPDGEKATRAREALSHLLSKAGDLKGAADQLRRAVAIRDKQRNADAAARDRSALSDVLTKDGDLKGAADVLREAVLLWEAVPDGEKAARTRAALRNVLSKAGRKDEAKAVRDVSKVGRKTSLDEVWKMLEEAAVKADGIQRLSQGP